MCLKKLSYSDFRSDTLLFVCAFSHQAKLALTSGSRIDWGLVRRLQDVNAPIALEDLGIDPNVWYRRFGRWFSDLYTCAFCRQQPDDESIMEKSSKESSPINEDVWAPYLMSGSLLHASFMPTYAGSNVLESVKRKMKAVVTLMKFQKSSEIKAPSAAGEADTILSGIEEGKPASAMESAESTAESTVAEEIAEMEDEEDARIRLLSGLKNKIAESYAAGLISLQVTPVTKDDSSSSCLVVVSAPCSPPRNRIAIL